VTPQKKTDGERSEKRKNVLEKRGSGKSGEHAGNAAQGVGAGAMRAIVRTRR
jgi:hypothetical protein